MSPSGILSHLCARVVKNHAAHASGTVSGLLLQREYDSAIRKGFVILKERLCSKFNVERTLDGSKLVNRIFGTNGCVAGDLPSDDRQALRNLLDGMYGFFRNTYGHEDANAPWHVADAVLSMINTILKTLGDLP